MTFASFRVGLAAPIAGAACDPGAAAQTPPASSASRFAVAMAEAQRRQALAGYWPHIGAKCGLTRLDEGRIQPGGLDSARELSGDYARLRAPAPSATAPAAQSHQADRGQERY